MNPVNPVNLVILSLLVFTIRLTTFAQVETVIQREMSERRIPGLQIAVVKEGRIVLSKSFGTVTNKTIFPIYSCTKAFTGVAIMQLVEDGKVELSAPVSRYLDGLPTAWQQITIRQLLTHVSGLPNILNLLDPVTYGLPQGTNEEQIWTKLKAMRCRCRPSCRRIASLASGRTGPSSATASWNPAMSRQR